MDSPIGVLGVSTVGDLVGLLVSVAEAVGEAARRTRESPVEDLGLSQHALRPLLSHWCGNLDHPPTAGDLADLVKTGRLGDVRQIGDVRTAEITAALRTAGLMHDPERATRT